MGARLNLSLLNKFLAIIVHYSTVVDSSPKNDFIHPQVVSNPYEFLSSAEHKRRYFDGNKKKKYYGIQKGPLTVWFPTFFKRTFVFS